MRHFSPCAPAIARGLRSLPRARQAQEAAPPGVIAPWEEPGRLRPAEPREGVLRERVWRPRRGGAGARPELRVEVPLRQVTLARLR